MAFVDSGHFLWQELVHVVKDGKDQPRQNRYRQHRNLIGGGVGYHCSPDLPRFLGIKIV